MEHLQSDIYPSFFKSNEEEVFSDSLLDIFDECQDWNPSIVESSKIKAREQRRESDDLLINEILYLSQSSDSFLSNADQENFNELNSTTLSEDSSQIIIGRQALPRLCQICGEVAGKHVYYGGQCCTSCRAFFRRSVQNNSYKQFICCSQTKDCIINLKTRKACQLCRFQKCVSAGMRVSWVFPDRERRSKKSAMTLNNNKPPLPSFNDPEGLTSIEVSIVFTINNNLHKNFLDNLNTMVKRDSDFLIDFVDYLAFPTRSEYPYLKMAMSLEKIQLLSLISMGTSNSSLHFSQEDLYVLYQINSPKINIFRELSSIKNPNFPDIDELINSVRLLHLNNNETIQNLPSRVEFTLQHYLLNHDLCPNENDNYSTFLHLVSQINSWVMDDENVIKQDKFSYIIMLFILFFDRTDSVKISGVKFKDPEMIDRAQLAYVQMLKRYFQRKYPRKSSKKFLKGIMLPSLIAEVRQLSNQLHFCTAS
uniref:Nuclear receptor domain-containing protein n=1 Tax=Lepeophtheirus salmonis TaxID=72036 RepID=A0A0K2UPM0_LEPSM